MIFKWLFGCRHKNKFKMGGDGAFEIYVGGVGHYRYTVCADCGELVLLEVVEE